VQNKSKYRNLKQSLVVHSSLSSNAIKTMRVNNGIELNTVPLIHRKKLPDKKNILHKKGI
jgi:hypothetical protein